MTKKKCETLSALILVAFMVVLATLLNIAFNDPNPDMRLGAAIVSIGLVGAVLLSPPVIMAITRGESPDNDDASVNDPCPHCGVSTRDPMGAAMHPQESGDNEDQP